LNPELSEYKAEVLLTWSDVRCAVMAICGSERLPRSLRSAQRTSVCFIAFRSANIRLVHYVQSANFHLVHYV
jgi:hypothetical protein